MIRSRLLSGVTGAPRQLRPAGDFDGNGFADLAIGAPGRDLADPERPDAGVTAVLYGRLFADGFEAGGAGAWSSAVP